MNKKLLIAAVGAAQANVLPTIDTACASDPIAADAIKNAEKAYNEYTKELAKWNARIDDTDADADAVPPVLAADGLETLAGSAAQTYANAVAEFDQVANTQGTDATIAGDNLLSFSPSGTENAANVSLGSAHALVVARDAIQETKSGLEDLDARLGLRETDAKMIRLRMDAADESDCEEPNNANVNSCRVMTVNKTAGDAELLLVTADLSAMQALISAAKLAAAELEKYDGAVATTDFESLNIATAVGELADLESYATWRSTEFGAAQTLAASTKSTYTATAGALTTANDDLARLYQSRGRDAIDTVITFNGTTGTTFRTVVGGEFENDQTNGYAEAVNGRVPYVAAMKDVTWIEVGAATIKADQTGVFARFTGGSADDLTNAESTSGKTTLTTAGGDVTVKSVNATDKSCIISASVADVLTDYMFPMEAFTQTLEQIAVENVNWPRTTRTADALSIRSKHYYTNGIQATSTCLACFYVAGTADTDDWVWSPTCNQDGPTGENLCNAIAWKSDYTLQAEADALVVAGGSLYDNYEATAATKYLFQADSADLSSDTAADLFVAEYVTLTKHRLMRAAYQGGCVIGTLAGELYYEDKDSGTASQKYKAYVNAQCYSGAPTSITGATTVIVPALEQKYDMQLGLKAASGTGTDATSQINKILGDDQVAANVGGGAAIGNASTNALQSTAPATIFALATNMHALVNTKAAARWAYQRGKIEKAVMDTALNSVELEITGYYNDSTAAESWAQAQKVRMDTLLFWQRAQIAEERARVDQSLNQQDITRAKALIAGLRVARDPLYAALSTAEHMVVIAFQAQQAQIVVETEASTKVSAMGAAVDPEEQMGRANDDANADIDRFKKRVLGLNAVVISDELLMESTAEELAAAVAQRDSFLAMQATAVADYTREVAMCKSSEYQQAQRLLAKRTQQQQEDDDLAAEVKLAYDLVTVFAPAGDAEVGSESNADCSFPEPSADGEQLPRPLCKETFCCGAAQKFLKDGTKLTVETCQLEFETSTYTYYPPLAEGALSAPQPETWRWQCISGAQKLVAAATAALAASYMMA